MKKNKTLVNNFQNLIEKYKIEIDKWKKISGRDKINVEQLKQVILNCNTKIKELKEKIEKYKINIKLIFTYDKKEFVMEMNLNEKIGDAITNIINQNQQCYHNMKIMGIKCKGREIEPASSMYYIK